MPDRIVTDGKRLDCKLFVVVIIILSFAALLQVKILKKDEGLKKISDP